MDELWQAKKHKRYRDVEQVEEKNKIRARINGGFKQTEDKKQ